MENKQLDFFAESLDKGDEKGVTFHNFAIAPVRIVCWPTRDGKYGGYITQPTSFFQEGNNNVEVTDSHHSVLHLHIYSTLYTRETLVD